jgi:hypothetical protein
VKDANATSWPEFRRRLGIYLVGISIGLMLLAFFHRQRTLAAAKQAAQQTQPQQPTPAR